MRGLFSDPRVGTTALLVVLVASSIGLAATWQQLKEQADRAFQSGDYRTAAERYNQSGYMALEAGQLQSAARIFVSLANCYAEGRLSRPQLERKYLKLAASILEEAAEKKSNLLTKANLIYEAAGYLDRADGAGLGAEANATYGLAASTYVSAIRDLYNRSDPMISVAAVKLLDARNTQGLLQSVAREGRWAGMLTFDLGFYRESAKVFSTAAVMLRKSSLRHDFLQLVNLSAVSYVKDSEERSFRDAAESLLSAAYLYQFNNFTEQAKDVSQMYRARASMEIQRLLRSAEENGSRGMLEEAGLSLFQAGILLYGLGDEEYRTVFGRAADSLEEAADSLSKEGNTTRILSKRASLYHRAAVARYLNQTDPRGCYRKAGTFYDLLAQELMKTGTYSDLFMAHANLSTAAAMFSRAGMAEEAKRIHVKAARAAEELAVRAGYSADLFQLKAGREYDLAGMYREAGISYAKALKAFPLNSPAYPWQQMELLEILGYGRRLRDARRVSEYLASQGLYATSFFASPSYGGYDVITQLGSNVTNATLDGMAYRAYVTENLLMAAAYLANGLPWAARSILDSAGADALSMDPPNNALYRLLDAATEAQQRGGIGAEDEVETNFLVLSDLYLEDLCGAISDVLPTELFLARTRELFKTVLADVRDAAGYTGPVDQLYQRVSALDSELADERIRNVTGHLQLAELLGEIGRRRSFQGRLNESGQAFELAAYHSCAGEDFQKAVMYRDLAVGCYGARTFLTAAVYAVADSMLQNNHTLKLQAAAFIEGNLSRYLEPRMAQVLLSVLEGRRSISAPSNLAVTASLGLAAVFVLVTSYLLLIWEPSQKKGGDEQEEQHREDGAEDSQGAGRDETPESPGGDERDLDGEPPPADQG